MSSGLTAPASPLLRVERSPLGACVDCKPKSDPDGQTRVAGQRVFYSKREGRSPRLSGAGRLPRRASVSAVGVAATAMCLLLLAGRGGRSLFTAAKTRSCLAGQNTRIDSKLYFVAGSSRRHPFVAPDVVASTATGGAFVATLPDNVVTISFGATLADAANITAAYERFAFPNVRTNIQDVLKRYQNAVLLWHRHPSNADLALITGCVK